MNARLVRVSPSGRDDVDLLIIVGLAEPGLRRLGMATFVHPSHIAVQGEDGCASVAERRMVGKVSGIN